MAARKAPRGKPKTEMVAPQIGSVGLKHSGGVIREEFVRELQGWRGIKVFREMGDNSAEVGSSLAVIRLVATRAQWKVEPYCEPGKPPEQEDVRRAEWFDSCFGDMDRPWTSVVRSAMTMLQYGFSPHEIVLKVRDGVNSKYSDGLIGLKNLAFRPQDSLDPGRPWDLTPNGECLALFQRNPTTQQVVRIPRGKFLNFRPTAGKDNPEGVSVLRHVYFTYFFAKRMRETEGIGVERSFNGLPVMYIPAECLAANASADLVAVADGAKQIVENIRNDQDAGVVLGQDYKDGQPLFKFELLSASGSSLPDTSKIIDRYDKRIEQSLSTDFMMLGHEGVGSYALGDSKLDMFELAVEGYLDFVAEEIQQVLVPMLLMLNGWPAERCPKVKHLPLEKAALAPLGDYVSKLKAAGVLRMDDGLEDHMRKVADLPPFDPKTERKPEPLPTNTKPTGNEPDKPKPPESNPGKAPEKDDDEAPRALAAMAETATVLAAALVDKQSAAMPDQHFHFPAPSPTPVEVRAPDVFVEAPSVKVTNEVQPAAVHVAAPSVSVAAPKVTVEGPKVQDVRITEMPQAPEFITTVEERDRAGLIKRTRKRPVKG